jgi:hypothetical protein
LTIIPIDIQNKNPTEVVDEMVEKMKQIDPELFERAAKRPKVKRTKQIITIGIDSELSQSELHDLLQVFWLDLIKKGKVKNFVRSIIVEYEKLENHITTIKGINNGSGHGDFYVDETLPQDYIFK